MLAMIEEMLLVLIVTLLALLAASLLTGCDSVTVRYGDASYTRTSLFTDKHLDGVSLSKSGGDLLVEVNKADTETRVEVLEAARALLEAAR